MEEENANMSTTTTVRDPHGESLWGTRKRVLDECKDDTGLTTCVIQLTFIHARPVHSNVNSSRVHYELS